MSCEVCPYCGCLLAELRPHVEQCEENPLRVQLLTFARRVTVATKHGPQGRGGEGRCSVDCAKCEAERIIAAAQHPT